MHSRSNDTLSLEPSSGKSPDFHKGNTNSPVLFFHIFFFSFNWSYIFGLTLARKQKCTEGYCSQILKLPTEVILILDFSLPCYHWQQMWQSIILQQTRWQICDIIKKLKHAFIRAYANYWSLWQFDSAFFFFLILLHELEQKQYICQLYRRKKKKEAFAIRST